MSFRYVGLYCYSRSLISSSWYSYSLVGGQILKSPLMQKCPFRPSIFCFMLICHQVCLQYFLNSLGSWPLFTPFLDAAQIPKSITKIIPWHIHLSPSILFSRQSTNLDQLKHLVMTAKRYSCTDWSYFSDCELEVSLQHRSAILSLSVLQNQLRYTSFSKLQCSNLGLWPYFLVC